MALKLLAAPLLLSLLMIALSPDRGYSQSICIYLTDDETYVNPADSGSITFYKNGKVAVNGKVDRHFSYAHEDCTINLFHKGKRINTLTHSAGYFDFEGGQLPDRYNCDCLIDRRKIVYIHLEEKK